jgi:hypothetical protein
LNIQLISSASDLFSRWFSVSKHLRGHSKPANEGHLKTGQR